VLYSLGRLVKGGGVPEISVYSLRACSKKICRTMLVEGWGSLRSKGEGVGWWWWGGGT